MDFSITKTQKITERFSGEFRAEFYNVMNHPTFATDAIGATCTLASCTADDPSIRLAVAASATRCLAMAARAA